jgi:phage terminase large subunit-like protein
MQISTSKWPTWLGLILGGLGALMTYEGTHVVAWSALAALGTLLASIGDSLVAKKVAS